ncbi:MAG: Gfo/Idh/MocA family oxidoreductase [Armatimonadetes bacterium]|nr:Gfo/Idh/MocA family oxidoreductase [Armatimonadota bacterium]
MNKVRCGVVGTGGMGQGHCEIIPTLEEVELTAVCDIDPGVCKSISEKYNVPGFIQYEELLDSGLVDMVLIATPHYFHPPIAMAAFEQGLHVLSEKPIAVTVSTADAMIAAARKSGKKFGVMFQMRSLPVTIAAKEFIDQGRLGEIYRTSLIMGWYRTQAYYDSGTWRATWAGEGGGVLINQAPHAFDIFTYLGGLPGTIYAKSRARLHKIEVEDECRALLEYPNGGHGYLYASTDEAPGRDVMEICGDRGKIIITNGELSLWELKNPIREFTETSTDVWSGPASEAVSVELEGRPTGHGAITANFARSILYDEPLLAPGDAGINAVELINGLILSSHRGQEVSLPVDRKEYDTLIAELQAGSKHKDAVNVQRVTDPNLK